MIEDTGRVVSIKGDKAMVEVEPTSACAKCASSSSAKRGKRRSIRL